MIKILLIEDEAALRETLEEILVINDFEVIACESGEDGLEVIKTWIPDLIICDIMMPGMSGFEVIKKIQANDKLKDIPFIFLSALASEEDRNRGIEAGANGYITKPFKSAVLIAAITQLI